MLIHMDVEQLTAFERIVREGSFSRAAWTMQIAQPTISARIQALEAEVGGALFVRGGRRVALTALGASFLPYARRALEVLAEGVEAARLTHVGQRGRITIGVLGSLSGGFLAPALAQFHREHPQVECFVRAADHEPIVELLCDGVVELGVIAWPCIAPPVADLTPLLHLREPVVLVVPPSNPLAERASVTQAEIVQASKPLFRLRWWPGVQLNIERIATQAECVMDVSMETARHLLLAGTGMGFFTRTLIAADLAAGRMVELSVSDMPPLFRDSVLVRLNRPAPLSAAALEFVAVLRAHAQQLRLLKGASVHV